MFLTAIINDANLLNFTIQTQESSVTNSNEFLNNAFNINFLDTGVIISISDNVLNVRGLSNVMVGEIVKIPSKLGDLVGQALNLNADGTTGIVLFGDETAIVASNIVYRTFNLLTVNTGWKRLGSVIDALGFIQIAPNPVFANFRGELNNSNKLDLSTVMTSNWASENMFNVPYARKTLVESKAPGIITRQSVNRAMYTGIKAIDGLIPVGRGQRELIIGDRQTGKTTIAIDTIMRQNTGLWVNNALYDVFSIYTAVGQKRSNVVLLHNLLNTKGCLSTTTIVAATASEPAALQYLAPYTGASYGEHYRDFGKDALIIYDDLSKHAVAYRQMSLLLRRPPGREAYPGDVFYLHSRLLERAAQLNSSIGGGSMTALPIIETLAGDVTAYIPTNVISITDGQIFLEAELFFKGIRPAINMGLSVSRVGSAAQIKAMKTVAGSLKLQLAQFRELEAFVSFGGDLDEATQSTINRGLRLVELLKQAPHKPYDVHSIIVVLYAGLYGFLDRLPLDQVLSYEQKLINEVQKHTYLINLLQTEGNFTPVTRALTERVILDVLKTM